MYWTHTPPTSPTKPWVFHAQASPSEYQCIHEIITWARGQFDLEGNLWQYTVMESSYRRMEAGLLQDFWPSTPDTVHVCFLVSFLTAEDASVFRLRWGA